MSASQNTSTFTHLTSSFNLDEKLIPHLSHYYRLHWSLDYFHDLLTNLSPTGVITHQGQKYHLICPDPESYPAKTSGQVAVSFRKIKNSSTGYVLVRRLF